MTNVYTADQALSDLQEQFKLLDYKNPEHQKKRCKILFKKQLKRYVFMQMAK